jgi:hypothetical protein
MIPVAPPQGQPLAPQGAPQGQSPVTIDAVVQLLRDDRMRGFRIDIETDSLVESDQKQERADAVELVTAIGGFFKEFGPIVAQMPPLAPMASQLLCFAVRRYKVGTELEEVIEKSMAEVVQHLQNPTPPQPSPEDQVKLQVAQAKGQAEVQKAQASVQAVQVKAKAEGDKAQLEMFHAKIASETTLQLAQEKHLMEKEAMMLNAEIASRADARAHELHQTKLQHEREAHAHKLQQSDQQHQQTLEKGHQDMTAKAESHKQGLEQTKAKGETAKASAAPKAEPKEPKANPVEDVVKIIEAVGKSSKAKKIIRDKDGKITGIE